MEGSTGMGLLEVNEILLEKLLHSKWGCAGFDGVFHIQELSIKLYQPVNHNRAESCKRLRSAGPAVKASQNSGWLSCPSDTDAGTEAFEFLAHAIIRP